MVPGINMEAAGPVLRERWALSGALLGAVIQKVVLNAAAPRAWMSMMGGRAQGGEKPSSRSTLHSSASPGDGCRCATSPQNLLSLGGQQLNRLLSDSEIRNFFTCHPTLALQLVLDIQTLFSSL